MSRFVTVSGAKCTNRSLRLASRREIPRAMRRTTLESTLAEHLPKASVEAIRNGNAAGKRGDKHREGRE